VGPEDLTPEELKNVMSLASVLYEQDTEHKSALAAAEEVGVPPGYMARAIGMVRADNERQKSLAKGRWKAVGTRIVALLVIAGIAYGFWYFEVSRPAGSTLFNAAVNLSQSSAPSPIESGAIGLDHVSILPMPASGSVVSYGTSDLPPASITFQNQTNTPVDVYWLDAAGNKNDYGQVPPNAQTTATDEKFGTPWLIADNTGKPIGLCFAVAAKLPSIATISDTSEPAASSGLLEGYIQPEDPTTASSALPGYRMVSRLVQLDGGKPYYVQTQVSNSPWINPRSAIAIVNLSAQALELYLVADGYDYVQWVASLAPGTEYRTKTTANDRWVVADRNRRILWTFDPKTNPTAAIVLPSPPTNLQNAPGYPAVASTPLVLPAPGSTTPTYLDGGSSSTSPNASAPSFSLPTTLFTGRPPADSGAGIVICDPVAVGAADSDLGAFGAGCGRWLQFIAGGRGELGKTPVTDDIVQARSDMAREGVSSELTPSAAGLIGKALGVPFVATGTVQGDAAQCVLTYTLWKLPSMTEDGTPIAITGTEAQVCAGLPGAVSQFMTRLGISDAATPTPPQAPVLCDIGMASWQSKPPPIVIRNLTADADNDPLAATMLLDNAVPISPTALASLYRVPDNVSALYAMAGVGNLITAQLTQALDLEHKRFPNNYGLACAQLRRFVYRQNLPREIVTVQVLPQCAPGNPWSYFRVAQTFSDTAQTIRQGRFYADIPAAEMPTLEKLYDGAEKAAARAARLLPNDPNIALAYSEAALFNGDEKTADVWIWKAMALAPDDEKPYWRALEMFQPKWTTGHTKDLLKVVREVEANGHLFDQLCSEVVYAMSASGVTGDMFDKAEQRAEMVATVRPSKGALFIVPAPTFGYGKLQAAN
jgi:hypothetical protein